MLLSCPRCRQWQQEIDPAPAGPFLCPVCGVSVGDSARPAAVDSETATLAPASAPPVAQPDRPAVPGYEILEELGRGGMGVVYKARQIGLNRLVALKMILSGLHAGKAERDRFRAEAEAVARLSHPNIVQIYEVGESGGCPFFSLEFVEGGSLADKLDGTPWRPRPAAERIATLARAMHAAHKQGVIHRDLKPANVLLTADGQPKITDFGLVKRLDDAAGPTQSGAILGTPSYMAPEQAGGKSKEIGPSTDVYALGAILYELLTGRPPFRAATPLDTVLQVIGDEPVPPRQLQSKTPRDLETICLKCLRKEPKKRYGSALALADDLQRFLDGKPIAARRVSRLERGWRWCRRNPWVAGLTAAVFVSLAVGAAVASWFAVQARDEAQQVRDEALNVRRQLYAADMVRVQRAWDDHYIDRVRELLDGQTPEHTGGVDLRGFEWYVWRRRAYAEQTIVDGVTGLVTCLAVSPDGRSAAVGTLLQVNPATASELKVYSLATGAQGLSLPCKLPHVQSVAFRPDGRRLAAVGDDRTIHLYDPTTGQELPPLSAQDDSFVCVAYSRDGARLTTAGLDRSANLWSVRVWDPDAATEVHAFRWKPDEFIPSRLVFDPDGRLVVAGPAAVKVLDLTTYQEVSSSKNALPSGRLLAVSPDGQRLARRRGDGISLWGPPADRERFYLEPGAHPFHSAAFSPDGKYLATGDLSGGVRVWNAETGQEWFKLLGHGANVFALAFTPDGRRIVSGAGGKWDGTLRVWDASAQPGARTVDTGQGGILALAFSPDGARLASASLNGVVKLWDAASWGEVRTFQGPISGDLSFSPDGGRLACGSPGHVRVWTTADGKEVLARDDFKEVAQSTTFAPGGASLARVSVVTSGAWSVETLGADGKTERKVDGPPDDGSGQHCIAALAPGGRLLATGGDDGRVRLWDATTGRLIFADPQVHLRDRVSALAFSAAGRLLASGAYQTVTIWDAQTGRQKCVLKQFHAYINSCCFNPDGTRLAVAAIAPTGVDAWVSIWDVTTGQEVLSFKGAGSSLAFSPDGRRLAVAAANGTITIWDGTPSEPAK